LAGYLFALILGKSSLGHRFYGKRTEFLFNSALDESGREDRPHQQRDVEDCNRSCGGNRRRRRFWVGTRKALLIQLENWRPRNPLQRIRNWSIKECIQGMAPAMAARKHPRKLVIGLTHADCRGVIEGNVKRPTRSVRPILFGHRSNVGPEWFRWCQRKGTDRLLGAGRMAGDGKKRKLLRNNRKRL